MGWKEAGSGLSGLERGRECWKEVGSGLERGREWVGRRSGVGWKEVGSGLERGWSGLERGRE